MSGPDVILNIDFDDDGVVSDPAANVRAFKMKCGRSNGLERMRAREFTVDIENNDGEWSPKNTAGAHYPNFTQGKYIRLYVGTPSIALQNLCDNPSVETDLNGWTGVNITGSLERLTTRARYGKYACRVQGSASQVSLEIRQRSGTRFSVTAGNTYSAMLHAICESGTPVGQFGIAWYDSGGAFISASNATYSFQAGGGWTRMRVTGAAPGGAVTAVVRFQESVLWGVGDYMWFDGCMFIAGSFSSDPALAAYIDGDIPLAFWDGTAHQSTSGILALKPGLLASGFIDQIEVRREGPGVATTQIRCESVLDQTLDRLISMAPLEGNVISVDNVFNRAVDLLEIPEAIDDGGFNKNPSTGPVAQYSALGGVTVAAAQTSPDTPLEGVRCLKVTKGSTINAGDGWRCTVTGTTVNARPFRAAVFVKLRDVTDANKDVTLQLNDNTGTPVASTTANIPSGGWTYIEVTGTWPAGRTARYVELVAAESWSTNGWLSDGHHLSREQIDREFRRSSTPRPFAHVSAYERSGRSVLNDIADSAGGVIWEGRLGDIIMEGFDYRSASAIPLTRFSDSPDLDGFGFDGPLVYRERLDTAFTEVKVFSNGELTPISASERELWSLDPVSAFAANEVRTYRGLYFAEEGRPIISGRTSSFIPRGFARLSAGALTLVLTDFGTGFELQCTAGGSGATVTSLHVLGPYRQLQSERSMVEYSPAGAAGRRFRRTLPLEMPHQGDRTDTMTAVAEAKGDRYLSGAPSLRVTLLATDLDSQLIAFGLELSDPVWVRHNSGPTHLGLNGLYFIEGMEVQGQATERGWDVRTTYDLEPA